MKHCKQGNFQETTNNISINIKKVMTQMVLFVNKLYLAIASPIRQVKISHSCITSLLSAHLVILYVFLLLNPMKK